MAVNVEELAARVDHMEREIGELKAANERRSSESYRWGLKVISSEERRAISQTLREIIAEMGGVEFPAGSVEEHRDRIRERLRSEGVADDNWFSRTVREMREE